MFANPVDLLTRFGIEPATLFRNGLGEGSKIYSD
jgi:hypothetical protein